MVKKFVFVSLKHLSGLIIALIVAPFIYLAMDRSVPVQITKQEMIGDSYPGGTVTVRWEGYRLDDLPFDGVIRHQFIDSEGILHELAEVPIVSRTDHAVKIKYTFSRQFILPPAMAVGPAAMVGWRYYRRPYNPFHEIWPVRVPIERLNFIVKPAPSATQGSIRQRSLQVLPEPASSLIGSLP